MFTSLIDKITYFAKYTLIGLFRFKKNGQVIIIINKYKQMTFFKYI